MWTLYTLLILIVAIPGWSATWYVRTDGGTYGTTSTTCNGQTDAAYSVGNGPNCAVNHPFEILGTYDNSPKTQRISGGDTVIIKNGSYKMGYDSTAYNSGNCASGNSYSCQNNAVPSGPSSSAKTKIYGEGWNTGCTTKPELWGAGNAWNVLTLEGASNTDIRCLDITDHDDCGHRVGTNQCTESSASLHAQAGISYYNGSNNELTDVKVHGLGDRGVYSGKQTNFSMTRVEIVGNNWAGLDQDTYNADDAWAGANTFTSVQIMWNGCAENYPVDGSYNNCMDQNDGGYGDGFATPGGGTAGSYSFTDCSIKYNVSDGLDLLYLSSSAGTITVERSIFEGNVGNPLKIGAGNNIIRNNQIISNCNYWAGKSFVGENFSPCRAGGNAVVVSMDAGTNLDIVNNSITGESDILIEVFGCGGGESINIKNNIIYGYTQWNTPEDKASFFYAYDGCSNFSTAGNNIIYNVSEPSPCSGQTNCTSADPGFVAINYLSDVFDLNLQSGSAARDAGLTVGTTVGQTTIPAVDFNSYSRGSGAVDLGALEYGSTSGGTSSPRATGGGTIAGSIH